MAVPLTPSYEQDHDRGSLFSSHANLTIRRPKRQDRLSSQRYPISKSFTFSSPSSTHYPSQAALDWSTISTDAQRGIPYRFWSMALLRNFDSRLYNEFRRSALDDLLTRHSDYGFTTLLSFYQASISSPSPSPAEVLTDLVYLSCDQTTRLSAELTDILNSAMTGGLMEDTNRRMIDSLYHGVYDQRLGA